MSEHGQRLKRVALDNARKPGETKSEYYGRLIDQEEKFAADLERGREKFIREDGYEGDHLP